jgi:hypothetical protein
MSIVECANCGWIGSDNDFDGDFELVQGIVLAICSDCITDGVTFEDL